MHIFRGDINESNTGTSSETHPFSRKYQTRSHKINVSIGPCIANCNALIKIFK